MDIELKIGHYDDKDKLVLALANSGYKLSVQQFKSKPWENAKSYWSVTIHDYDKGDENSEHSNLETGVESEF